MRWFSSLRAPGLSTRYAGGSSARTACSTRGRSLPRRDRDVDAVQLAVALERLLRVGDIDDQELGGAALHNPLDAEGLLAAGDRRRDRVALLPVSAGGEALGDCRALGAQQVHAVDRHRADAFETAWVSTTGANWASVREAAELADPGARRCRRWPTISRSVLPASVSMDERKEPVAASPARSIATTTATPSATERMVSAVRSRSRRSGRRMSRRRSQHHARSMTECGRRAVRSARRRWRRPRRCGWPSGRWRRSAWRSRAAGPAPGRRWRCRDCPWARRRSAGRASAPGRGRWRRAASGRRKAGRESSRPCPPAPPSAGARAPRPRCRAARASSSGSSTFSSTVRVGSSWKNWKTKPTRVRRSAVSSASRERPGGAAVDQHLAGSGKIHGARQVEQRGLAAPAAAQQRGDAAGFGARARCRAAPRPAGLRCDMSWILRGAPGGVRGISVYVHILCPCGRG